MKNVAIIGGGAAGLAAGIYASLNGDKVTIFERNSLVGKKILLTGNGKCNYFNDDQNLKHYHSSNKDILDKIITVNNLKNVLDLFDRIGIVPKIKNGYYYPNSNQAVSVKEALLFECQRLGVKIKTDFMVTGIIKKDKFIINPNKENLPFDKIIISAGSKAAPKTGSDGNGYDLALSLGHTIIKPLPALTSLIAKENLKECKGIRTDAAVSLWENGRKLKTETGELQITDYGISGICVFNLSGRCARGIDEGKKEEIIINFLPNIDNFITYMDNRNRKVVGRNISRLFDGLLNYKLADYLIKKSKINKDALWDDLTNKEKIALNKNITEFKLEVKAVNNFEKAQTCIGGIPLTEINPKTLESLITKDLYFAGEILDVNGDCGGYNLTFAFVSGIIVGKDKHD